MDLTPTTEQLEHGVCAGCSGFPKTLGILYRCEPCRALIAAAPELLAILKALVNGRPAMGKARALITTLDPTTVPVTTPRDVACPSCRAGIGRPCKRPSGHTVFGGGFHAPRERAWEQMAR